MVDCPQPARIIETLGGDFYDPVAPADFPQAVLRYRNDRAAAELGLDRIDDEAWVQRFARFEPFEGSLPCPLALRYHGHQFRSYNPDIGDGRGFLYAQFRAADGRLMDLATKGSGQTPWSRFGDGRLTLKGGVREILATEMLEALGVETSRTLSLIETGEELHRGDEPSPTRSAVLVRLSHGHIRIGTFQRLAYSRDVHGLKALAGYVLANLFEKQGDDPVRLLELVVARTARLAGSYMAAGFVHGVLNSDNINVTGESFDYGPWRFAPAFDPGFTAAYFDHTGLYAFARQAEAIWWDVAQLASALSLMTDVSALEPVLGRFAALYRAALVERLFWRLGIVARDGDADAVLASRIETALFESQVPLDRFFFDWRGGRLRRAKQDYAHPAFTPLAAALEGRATPDALDHPYWSDAEPCAMLIDEVEALWRPIAEQDDWAPLHAKVAAVRRMGDALARRGA
nr:YdiU family protein [Sphingomonas jejuensis]